jgi:hypothetical protein
LRAPQRRLRQAKRAVDAIVSAACAYLTSIGPTTRPDQKTKFIKT